MSESPPAPHDFGTAYVETYVGVATGVFVRQTVDDGPGLRVEGTCPRCHGRTASEYRYGLPGTGTKGLLDRMRGGPPAAPQGDADDALLREVHFCECGHPHPELPADAPFVGCGASWRVAALGTWDAQ
ncbi:hypothetical protein ACFYWX_20815 [Streptomyces sp. NPDC002888]|uniref:hypothetical protein n=1 Tax=Streptomyces sp. NPDC002888 TaxID=3364668 RepID=UPI0036D17F41